MKLHRPGDAHRMKLVQAWKPRHRPFCERIPADGAHVIFFSATTTNTSSAASTATRATWSCAAHTSSNEGFAVVATTEWIRKQHCGRCSNRPNTTPINTATSDSTTEGVWKCNCGNRWRCACAC